MDMEDKCAWPRCRKGDETSYCGILLCYEHAEEILEGDMAVGHRLLAKNNLLPAGFQDGCYCGHCRPLQDLPIPSWEVPGDDEPVEY